MRLEFRNRANGPGGLRIPAAFRGGMVRGHRQGHPEESSIETAACCLYDLDKTGGFHEKSAINAGIADMRHARTAAADLPKRQTKEIPA